ncbi:MAG: peptide deformylase [Planctomycetaceae bacterium]|nr:peptide deformylase [Planctomycetaceae bacterium]
MQLQIRHYPDPVLMRPSAPVTEFDPALVRFVEDMFETMYIEEGVGLAAPQVGVNKRIFVVNCAFEEKGAEAEIALINPVIVEARDEQTGKEGCLSFPQIFADVTRANVIRIKYQDVKGNWHEAVGEGLLARAFQHELDHLDGKVFVDYLRPEQLQEIRPQIDELKREFKRNPQAVR